MLKIVFGNINDNHDWDEIYRIVPESRRQKADRYINEQARKVSLLAGKLLHDLVGNLDKDIVVNKCNKPYLKNNEYYFSISHSNDMAMVVLSDQEIGCDIEYIGDNHLDLAKRFFNEDEYLTIANSDNPKELFYRFWTIKEAYLKCQGQGLFKSLKSVHIVDNGINDEKYELIEAKPVFENYYVSIVLKRP